MIFSYYEVNKLPVIVIDKFYDDIAKQKIMEELFFLNNDHRKLLSPADTGSAWEPDDDAVDGKKYLKRNKGISLDNIYSDRNVSNILSENRKLFSPAVTEECANYHPLFRYLGAISKDATLVSYYEDSDYYAPHMDNAALSAITWFHTTPKLFAGGDLIIENELQIECISNRCVIIPSIAMHAVNEIKLDNNSGKNCGRFAISQFCSFEI